MANNFALILNSYLVSQVFDTKPDINADVRDVSHVAGVDVGWYIGSDGNYYPPPGLQWPQAQQAAMVELDNTTNVSVRCLERQQPVPNDWIVYRDTLRAIRDATTGDPNASFPPRPAYPPNITAPPGYPAGEIVWPPSGGGSTTFILPGGEPSSAVNLPIPQSTSPQPIGSSPAAPRPLRLGMA